MRFPVRCGKLYYTLDRAREQPEEATGGEISIKETYRTLDYSVGV